MMRSAQFRKVSEVPRMILMGLLLLLLIQILLLQFNKVNFIEKIEPLVPPRDIELYRFLSFGSDQLLSYLLLLKLQLHDNQKGKHVNYSHLDYPILKSWLLTIAQLNPDSDYPAFLASRIYSSVLDAEKIQQMIDVIDILFQQQPALHWRRMTEATLIAKHQLNDLPQALSLARKIAELPSTIKLPFWARDMELILLDEIGQKESALLLINSMLQSGDLQDRDEKIFLQQRLLKIQQELLANEHKLAN